MEEANKLIGAGKKNLVMGKVVEAVSALQEACGMLAKQYGDTADECGEAFFWCGKALLDLSRMENSVLGNALEGVPEEDEEEKPKDSNVESTENVDEKTRDELRVQVYDAMAEKKKEEKPEDGDVQKKNEEKPEDGDMQKKEEREEKKCDVNGSKSDETEENKENECETEVVDKKEERADKPEEAQGCEEEQDGDAAEMEGDDDDDDEEEDEKDNDAVEKSDNDDEEEVGNLQLAWEMLEVAKVIYKRKEEKENQLMAAQTHLKLGEVSAESGNYTQAVEDFQECLKLQLKHLDSDSRLLAETHYQLGLTFSLNLQYKEAIEQLNSSISVIKSRLEKLTELIDKAATTEELPEERKEMEELKALLPEIQEKVEDATEGLKMAGTATEVLEGVLDGASTSAFPGSSRQNGDTSSSSTIKGTSTDKVSSTNGHVSTAPVSDISHLVRKKRKLEESPVKKAVDKKVKQDDSHTNGVQEPCTNGVHKANGDADSMEVERK